MAAELCWLNASGHGCEDESRATHLSIADWGQGRDSHSGTGGRKELALLTAQMGAEKGTELTGQTA